MFRAVFSSFLRPSGPALGLVLALLSSGSLVAGSAHAKPAKTSQAKKPAPPKKPAPAGSPASPKKPVPAKKPTAFAPRPAAPAPESPVTPIALSLEVQRETLANGLRVVLHRDPSAPTVAVTVTYDVGSRDEQRGRSGFAHLFEHMMFQGSRNFAKGDHVALISRTGGTTDAMTFADRTYYYDVVPPSALALALWLEADRMGSLDISSVNFENQRKVVQEEYRMRVSNAPLGAAQNRLLELVYQGYFPYEHAPIGSMEDLDAARLEWAREFHSRYYTPKNAVLSISGDFDDAEAMSLVRKYFDGVKSAPPSPYQDPPFPEQTSQRTSVIQDDNLRTPGILYGWPTPPYRSKDHYALELAAVILADGETSRLNQLLVHDRALAQQASAWLGMRRGPDIFTLQILLAEGAKTSAVEKLVEGEIQRFSPTEAEVNRAKRRMKAAYVFGLESNLRKAEMLGLYEAWFGDSSLVEGELSHYLDVTKEDIARVTRQYLSPTRRSIVEAYPSRPIVAPTSPPKRVYSSTPTPAAKAPAAAAKAPAPVKPTQEPKTSSGEEGSEAMRAQATWMAALVALAGCASAPPSPGMRVAIPVLGARGPTSRATTPTREAPPAPGPGKDYQFPRVSWSDLPNGLSVGTIENHSLPIVELRVVFLAGSASEGEKYGLASLTAEWLRDGGAGRLTGSDVLRQIEGLGASFNVRADGDSTVLSLSVLKDELEPAIALLAQVVAAPRFDAREFTKLKKRASARAATRARGDGPWSAATLLARALYGAEPYSHAGATSAEIERLTMEDCRAFYQQRFTPKNAFIVVAGDVDPSRSQEIVERAFASFSGGAAPPPPSTNPPAAPELSVTLIDRPSSSQSDIFVGMLGPSPQDQAWAAYSVANHLLGGSAASRLFIDIREKSSLAYAVGSSLAPTAYGPSMFSAYAGTQTAKTGLAVKGLLDHLDTLKSSALMPVEVKAATSNLSDSLAVRLGTVGALADRVSRLRTLGLPDDYDARYTRAIRELDASAVEQAARRDFAGSRAIVVAGDAKVIGPMLSHFGEVVVVDADFRESRRLPHDPNATLELPRAAGQ